MNPLEGDSDWAYKQDCERTIGMEDNKIAVHSDELSALEMIYDSPKKSKDSSSAIPCSRNTGYWIFHSIYHFW